MRSPIVPSRFFRAVVNTATELRPLTRFSVAVAISFAVIKFRLWLGPTSFAKFPFAVMMPAVMLSGWIGGWGPGLLATVLLAAGAVYYWLDPVGSWAVHDKSDLLSVMLFVIIGVVFCALNHAWRRSVVGLRTSEERERNRAEELKRVLEVIPSAVWIAKDPNCREVSGNRAAATFLGVQQDQNVSQTPMPGSAAVPIRHFRNGRELAPNELPLQQAASTGWPQPPEEIEIELPGGQRRTMLGSATPLLDEQGNVRGSVAAFSDITERRQAESQKDEFLALLGHELRNPLSAICTASELLSGTLPTDSRARLTVEIIKRQSKQLTRLVDDLLDIGRITQGQMHLQQSPLDLSAVIQQAVETTEAKARQKRHNLVVVSSEAPLWVHGDFGRLVQCVGNVLENAVKYTTPGGQIRVETHAEGEAAVICITDNGSGIAPEFLPKAFELFVQGGRALERTEGGLGIGLAVVKQLVTKHGGEVAVQSDGVGKGTTVEIRLPRIPEPPDSKPAIVNTGVFTQRAAVMDD